MSKKYRILVESSPVVGEIGRHAFIVLQYAQPNGEFADLWKDENAIIYRSGPADPLWGGDDFNEITDINKMEWVNELNAAYVTDDDHKLTDSGTPKLGNTVTHVGAFLSSSDFNKFYGIKNPDDKPDTSLTLHKVYENDGSVDAQAILNELSLRFAHDNSNYNAATDFDENHSNSNTYAGWILQETLKEINKQSNENINIEAEMQIILSKLGNVPGFNNKDTIDIDMSLTMDQINSDLVLATIIRHYYPEEGNILQSLETEYFGLLETLNGPASMHLSLENMERIKELPGEIEAFKTKLYAKVQQDEDLWTLVSPIIENPSIAHDVSLVSCYAPQGGTNINDHFFINTDFSHGTAGSEQKSESETIQSVINDGLIYHWGGTTISSSTVNEAGFWAEINAAISDGFQPGRGNVINSTASDQVKNYYWQAEGLEDSVYLNSFGYISNFSQHLEDYNDKNAIIYRSDSAKPLSCL